MGEALLIKTGGTGSGGSSGQNGLITEIFMANTLWQVPQGIRNNEVSVRIFGGGGGGYCGGGNGGLMNNDTINISNESEIFITIGSGGSYGYNNVGGGTTSFGTYLSAFGGGIFGGGSGGGGIINNHGGRAIQFGGGGSGSPSLSASGSINVQGGIGGKWGGGGGYVVRISEYNPIIRGGCEHGNSKNPYEVTGYSGLAGNSGGKNTNAENGTNTIGMGLEFEGAGLAGDNLNRPGTADIVVYGAGGGYGGNAGSGYNVYAAPYVICGAGGGGGYGANGGNGFGKSAGNGLGGGGGGYGGDGGDAGPTVAGGGGGYGKHGKGGGWDINNNCSLEAGIAAGGYSGGNGGPGICIIQYYLD